jgi:hypothetical protein
LTVIHREVSTPVLPSNERQIRPLLTALNHDAERRYGELLKELARATPQTANPSGVAKDTPQANAASGPEPIQPTPYAQALADTGTSERKTRSLQALASTENRFQQATQADLRAVTKSNRP